MGKREDKYQRLQDSITFWAEHTFGENRKPESILYHLKKEVEEAIQNPLDIEEYADIGILWLNAAKKAGYEVSDLYFAMIGKMWVNKSRKWGVPDENGVVEHLKETEDAEKKL